MSADVKARGIAKRALRLAQEAGGGAYGDEQALDAIAAALEPNSGLAVSYDDTSGKIRISALASPVRTENGLISGGGVFWQSAFTFRVSAASYGIGGQLYYSAEQTVALDAADASNTRIDVIALNTAGQVVKITGTPASTPSEPDVDPATQLKLSFVVVPANSTQPDNVTNENVYLENTEWTSSTSGSGWNANSSNNPYAGTKCIEGTNVANGAYVQLQRGSAITPGDTYAALVLYVRSKASWQAGRVLRLQFYSGGVAKGQAVTLGSGYWGFDSSITAGYQQIVIPTGQFVLPAGTQVNQLRITDSGGQIGLYIDNVVLQAVGNSLLSTGQDSVTARASLGISVYDAATARAAIAVPATTVAGTTYTATVADTGAYLLFTSGSPVTFTIPPNVFPLGAVLGGEQNGAGVVTLTPGAGVTLRSRGDLLDSAGQYAVFQLKQVATNTWTVIGDMA